MPKFVFKKDVTFEAPVVVREPGTGVAFDFVGRFRLAERSGNFDDDAVKAFIGWRGIGCDDGPNGELPEIEANRQALLAQDHVRFAIIRAYASELVRYPEKNADAPAAPGPAARPN